MSSQALQGSVSETVRFTVSCLPLICLFVWCSHFTCHDLKMWKEKKIHWCDSPCSLKILISTTTVFGPRSVIDWIWGKAADCGVSMMLEWVPQFTLLVTKGKSCFPSFPLFSKCLILLPLLSHKKNKPLISVLLEISLFYQKGILHIMSCSWNTYYFSGMKESVPGYLSGRTEQVVFRL